MIITYLASRNLLKTYIKIPVFVPFGNNIRPIYFGLSSGMVGLAPKWVRLDPKLDKSGTFSDEIAVHLLGEPSFGTNLTQFRAKPDISTIL